MTEICIKVVGANASKARVSGPLTTGMVGAVARFSFDGVWKDLVKVAVFRGSGVTRDVLEWDGDCVRIPAEVLRKQGQLSVGVEGRNGDGSVVIPTVWVECGVVVCGANASGDVSTDPDLPVWAQIQSQIGPLEELQTKDKASIVKAINEVLRSGGGSVDEDAVERIVEAYLEEHPPEGGAVDPEAVGQMVEEYLREHPVETDKELLVEGAPADAAVVGSQLTTIKEYMYSQEKVAKFITTSPAILTVDTDRKKVKVYGGLLYYRGERTNIPETIVSIDQTSALSYTVWDAVDKAVKSIDPATFDGTRMFLIGILSRDYPTNTNYNYVPGPYNVNGYLYNAPVSQPVYVSTDGSDAWNAIGDRIHPFRTIGKAIASGAKTIIVFAGTYREPVSLSRTGDEFELLCKPVYQTDGPVLDKVVIDLSAQLDMVADSTTGLAKAAYASTDEDFIHKVFVGRTEALVCNDTFIEKGYTCNLWLGNTKLRPVLSLAECQATTWTWFYDGANVYANADPGAYCLNDGSVDYGVSLSYFRKVKLLGIEVRHAKLDGVKLLNCSDAEITDCVFGYSGVYTGLALENTSAIVRGCEAMFNRTDGLNIHGTGIADFIDCRSHDNGDDGISHHDKSSGTVIGGEYYGNGKGGVCSPTFGSRNSINGVNIHDNGVGVYAVADGTAVDGHPECNVSNCVIRNNGVGIKTQYYKFVCWGNVLEGNDTDVVEENGGIVETVRDSIPAPATAQVGQTIVVKEVDDTGKPVAWECADVPAGGSEEWTKLGDVTVQATYEIVPLSFTAGIVTVDTTTEAYGWMSSQGAVRCVVHPNDLTSKTKPVLGILKVLDADAGTFEFFDRDNIKQATAAYDPAVYKISLANVASVSMEDIGIYSRYKMRMTTPVLTTHGLRPFFMSTMSCVGMGACTVTTASGGGIFEVETMRYPADPNYMYKRSKLSYGQWYGGGYSSEAQAFEVVEAGGGKTQPPASGTVAFNVSNMVFVNGTRFELWGANDDQNR